MKDLKLSLLLATKGFDEAILELHRPIAETATAAMDDIVEIVKREARADIARAGFSKRWQNTLRVNRYPTRGVAIDAAAFLYHRIQYAGVFEEGATIHGQPYLWLPLSNAPKRVSRKRTTPQNLGAVLPEGLVSFKSRSGVPLMGAVARVSRTQAASDRPKASLAALKRGRSGTGVLRTIPLFSGIRVTEVPKQLNIRQICERARDRIPALYAANFEG